MKRLRLKEASPLSPGSRIRRALISVYDKRGLLPFVQGLRRFGVKIISTGGTAKLLKGNGIPVKEISEFTGFPEILAGRVKTLHPKVHGGILVRREDKRHLAQARQLGLELIDLVVVNLYPFEETARQKSASVMRLIEQIDIGGVALLRSAAKNFKSVGIVSRPSQYAEVLRELEKNRGVLSGSTRLRLAVEAFAETAYYDSVIQQTLAQRGRLKRPWPAASAKGDLTTAWWPERFVVGASRRQVLRYGENPHQAGVWYEWSTTNHGAGGLSHTRQLHGKELSFNNLLDLDAALQVVSAFDRPCAVVIKHTNPCGVACARSLSDAFQNAWASDPLSAFGGIVGFNHSVDKSTAQAILRAGFLECLIAPGYSAEALQLLRSAKKNVRIIEVPIPSGRVSPGATDLKQISGGLLIQEPDHLVVNPSGWRVVTSRKPTLQQQRDLYFAWTVSKFVRSNAIVIAKGEKTVGIGAGQMSRVDSVRIALKKAGKRARGAVMASDGFFPKPDGPAVAVKAGIRAIVQPGGSIQDPAVIRVAERAQVPMALTGERHFRH